MRKQNNAHKIKSFGLKHTTKNTLVCSQPPSYKLVWLKLIWLKHLKFCTL